MIRNRAGRLSDLPTDSYLQTIMPRSKSKKRKAQKLKIKSVMDFAKTEDEQWRVRQFHMLVLLADKTRMQALDEKDKSIKTHA